uniref:Uncharacterized protein n=1 Tax=Timema bartmani TaxID=61472 RepID=A0A7R9EX02_9NEOP|nr:unnamed protein product [Timema bartmani]
MSETTHGVKIEFEEDYEYPLHQEVNLENKSSEFPALVSEVPGLILGSSGFFFDAFGLDWCQYSFMRTDEESLE